MLFSCSHFTAVAGDASAAASVDLSSWSATLSETGRPSISLPWADSIAFFCSVSSAKSTKPKPLDRELPLRLTTLALCTLKSEKASLSFSSVVSKARLATKTRVLLGSPLGGPLGCRLGLGALALAASVDAPLASGVPFSVPSARALASLFF